MENNFGLRLNGMLVMSLVNDEKKVWNWPRRTISRHTCLETHPAVVVLKCEWLILTAGSSSYERVLGPYGSKTRRQPTGTPIGLSSSSAREI